MYENLAIDRPSVVLVRKARGLQAAAAPPPIARKLRSMDPIQFTTIGYRKKGRNGCTKKLDGTEIAGGFGGDEDAQDMVKTGEGHGISQFLSIP